MVTIVSHLQGPESSVSSLFKIDINQRRLVAPPARQERHSLDTGHGHDSNRIAFQERLAFKKGLVYVQDRWQTRAASQQTPHSKIRYHHWHASQLTASAEKGSMSTVQSPNDRSSCKLWIFPPFCPNLAWSKALLTLDTFQRLVPSIQKIWQSKIPMEWAIKSPASRKALQCLFCSSKLGLLDGKACNELDHMIHIDHMWARIIIRNLIWSLGRTVPKVHETGRRRVVNFLLRGIQGFKSLRSVPASAGPGLQKGAKTQGDAILPNGTACQSSQEVRCEISARFRSPKTIKTLLARLGC